MLPAGWPAAELLKLPGEASPSWAIFDPSWYLRAYTAACATLSDTSPAALLSFYLEVGQGQGHSPNRYFDETWYRAAYPNIVPDLRDGKYLSGFDHYCRSGHQTLAPHWLFNEQYYRDQNPDLAEEIVGAPTGVNGYDQFLRWGAAAYRRAHPFFDPVIYQAGLDPDAAQVSAHAGPFHHFLDRIEGGGYELRTSQYFDPAWYLVRYPEVASAIARGAWRCALHHYLANDTPTRFDPSPEFSEAHYLRRYPDVAAAVQDGGYWNGYAHFVLDGLAEGRLAEAASESVLGETESSTGDHAPIPPMEQPSITSEVRAALEDRRPDVTAEMRGTQGLISALTPSVRRQESAYQQLSRESSVQRYLNLLEASLTGMLFEDAPFDYWSGGKFDPNKRLLGRDWPSLACSMIGSVRMRNLRYACETVLFDGVEGDFIETGVWRGGACILMRGILEVYGDDTRRVFVADSFAGLPPPDPENFPADAGDEHHTHSQLVASRPDVEDNFRRFGLLDERVVFLEGWFKDTLPDAQIDQLAVLRLDGDMYESTIEALGALYHRVSYGGFVIVDDYQIPACVKAVNDFRERYGITSPMLPIDGWGTYWRVDHTPIR